MTSSSQGMVPPESTASMDRAPPQIAQAMAGHPPGHNLGPPPPMNNRPNDMRQGPPPMDARAGPPIGERPREPASGPATSMSMDFHSHRGQDRPVDSRGPLPNNMQGPEPREMERFGPGRPSQPMENRGPPPPDMRGPAGDIRGPRDSRMTMADSRGPPENLVPPRGTTGPGNEGRGPGVGFHGPPPMAGHGPMSADSHSQASRPPMRSEEPMPMAPRSQALDTRGPPLSAMNTDRPPARPAQYPSGPEYRGPSRGPQRPDPVPSMSGNSPGMGLDADQHAPRSADPRSQDPRSGLRPGDQRDIGSQVRIIIFRLWYFRRSHSLVPSHSLTHLLTQGHTCALAHSLAHLLTQAHTCALAHLLADFTTCSSLSLSHHCACFVWLACGLVHAALTSWAPRREPWTATDISRSCTCSWSASSGARTNARRPRSGGSTGTSPRFCRWTREQPPSPSNHCIITATFCNCW